MTLKLTKSQLQVLVFEMGETLKYMPSDFTDKLLAILTKNFYKRAVVKLLDERTTYTIQMDDATALALYLYYNIEKFDPTNFNHITMKTICDSIHQHYA